MTSSAGAGSSVDAGSSPGADRLVCMIVPQHRGELERFRPEIIPLQADTALQRQFTTWSESRGAFLAQQSPGWQRHYFRGNHADGSAGDREHQTRLHLPRSARLHLT